MFVLFCGKFIVFVSPSTPKSPWFIAKPGEVSYIDPNAGYRGLLWDLFLHVL